MSNIIKSSFTKSKDQDREILIQSLERVLPRTMISEESQPSFEERENESKLMLEQARLESKQLLDRATIEIEQRRQDFDLEKEEMLKEIEKLKEEAIRSGYQSGYEQGSEKALEDFNNQLEQANHIVQLAEDDYQKKLEELQPEMIQLAHALTKKVIGKELSTNSEIWDSMLFQIIQEVREHQKIKIYVESNWYEHTLKQKEEIKQLLSHTQELAIYPDSSLPEHGCTIETELGRMEASLDLQLNELKAQLQEVLQELEK
ncbi:flagellar assembly protein FliH [Bacillus sp. TS-2]|nr:flagellar assembly protein FliH [Bacillus sp. TS-2]